MISLPNVSSPYGAPMGRSLKMPRDRNQSLTMEVENLPLEDGYDSEGAYWGSPNNLYAVQSLDEIELEDGYDNALLFIRADSWESLERQVRESIPNAILLGKPKFSITDYIYQAIPKDPFMVLGMDEELISSAIDGLLAWLSDAIVNGLTNIDGPDWTTAYVILHEIQQPRKDICHEFKAWLKKHPVLYQDVLSSVVENLPWLTNILVEYHKVWGDNKFSEILKEITVYPIIGTYLGSGIGLWDNFNPEDFGLAPEQCYPSKKRGELNAFDLVDRMVEVEKSLL